MDHVLFESVVVETGVQGESKDQRRRLMYGLTAYFSSVLRTKIRSRLRLTEGNLTHPKTDNGKGSRKVPGFGGKGTRSRYVDKLSTIEWDKSSSSSNSPLY